MVPTINLLPPELLSEILQRVEQGPKARLNQHVRFLSHVDRNWRTIALDTPLLWTKIVTKTSFDAVHDFERITVWLRRSKTLPINFVLRDIEKGADRALLDILKAIGPTLETLFFESGHYWNLGRMGDGDSAVLSFPRLKKLRSKGILSLMVVQKHILGAVPSLKQLSIILHDMQGRDMLKDGWPWLTTLRIPFLPGQAVSELFSNAKHLQHISFSTDTSTLQDQRGCRHDALRSLFIYGYCQPTADFGDYFPSFPNLEYMGVNLRTLHGTPRYPSLSRLFRACGATLRYLELHTPSTDVTQFPYFLSLTPCVRFLPLYGGVTEECVEALVFRPDLDAILPELEMLSLSEIKFKQHSLWKLAYSRAQIPVLEPMHQNLEPAPSLTPSTLPSIAAMQISKPPFRRPLRYITMSEFARTHEHRTRFGWTRLRMRDDLGITLIIVGAERHMPRKDAGELLCLFVDKDAQWDWKERDYVLKPTW